MRSLEVSKGLTPAMSRLQYLLSQPKAALGTLLTLVLAATAVVGSGADFTAASANPANVFAAGTLHMVNSREGVAVLTAAALRPAGAPATGTVDLANDGSLSGDYRVSRSAPADSDGTNPLSAKINLTIVDCGAFAGASAPACGDGDDVPRYTGTLAAMGSVALGHLAASDKHRYEFRAGLDGSADNAYQGDDTSVQFDFDAV
jgi:hypothetical protein